MSQISGPTTTGANCTLQELKRVKKWVPALTCPACGSTAGKVIESRPGPAWRKRRIACANCRANYTTYTDEFGRVATVDSGMSRGVVAVKKHKARMSVPVPKVVPA